jgi:hypothetical protein
MRGGIAPSQISSGHGGILEVVQGSYVGWVERSETHRQHQPMMGFAALNASLS